MGAAAASACRRGSTPEFKVRPAYASRFHDTPASMQPHLTWTILLFAGPTSISFLLHSTATIPPHTFDNYDLRHHTAFDISSTGDGLIKVYHPARSSDPNSPSFALPSGVENRLPQDVIEQLVNSYFQNIAPLFPVVSRVEFLKEGKENPLLVYAVCGVAATRRDVPREVFNSLRTTINGIIKHNDVLSDTSLVNIQSLLILACVGDLHSQPLTAATSAAANRLGVAIRMVSALHAPQLRRRLLADPVLPLLSLRPKTLASIATRLHARTTCLRTSSSRSARSSSSSGGSGVRA